jgi:transcriptional regulator with XRE-family HTH domain
MMVTSVTTGPTPFAQLLYDYMWAQRPPLTAAKLAERTGLSKQTVSNWLNGRTEPQIGTLTLLAQRTGIPLQDLAEAAGTSLRESEPQDVWDSLLNDFQDFDEPTRQRILERIQALRDGGVSGAAMLIEDESGRCDLLIAEEHGGEYRTIDEANDIGRRES